MSRSSANLRVLTYHRVAEPGERADLDPTLISATPDVFVRQMQMLRRHCAVVGLNDALRAVETGSGLPPRAVLLTFDDGYEDLAVHAIPTLEALRLTATIFVPTAFPDHPERSFWADRLHRAFSGTTRGDLDSVVGRLSLRTREDRLASRKRLRSHLKTLPHRQAALLVDEICRQLGEPEEKGRPSVLGWDELRRLSSRGFSIASHSRHHPLLTRLSPAQMREEIVGARADLDRELGTSPPAFCYPNGSHDERVVSILREEGYLLAFTTLHGGNDLTAIDPLCLRRSNVSRRTGVGLLRLRLTRWGGWFDALRHRGDPPPG